MVCPSCGNQNASGKFCNECGQILASICPNCGNEEASGKFCNKCGATLDMPSDQGGAEPETIPDVALDYRDTVAKGPDMVLLTVINGCLILYPNSLPRRTQIPLNRITEIVYLKGIHKGEMDTVFFCSDIFTLADFPYEEENWWRFMSLCKYSVTPIKGMSVEPFLGRIDEKLRLAPKYRGLIRRRDHLKEAMEIFVDWGFIKSKVPEERMKVEPIPIALNQKKEDDLVKCPRCGSTQISSNKKGYSAAKGVAGVLTVGALGLLAGNIGSNKVVVTCLKCGHQWKL